MASVQSPRSRGCARATSSRIQCRWINGGENSRSRWTCSKLGHTRAPVAAQQLMRQRSNSSCKGCATRTRGNDRGDVWIFQLYPCQPRENFTWRNVRLGDWIVLFGVYRIQWKKFLFLPFFFTSNQDINSIQSICWFGF